jgi:hypothetical protein
MQINITKKILSEYVKQKEPSFTCLYATSCSLFKDISAFCSIEGNTYKDLKWPRGVGAYAIWKKCQNIEETLIYIGMTGKINQQVNGRAKLFDPENGFSKRALRYHPYSFTRKGSYKDYFEYEPKHSLKTIKKAPHEDRYAVHIPLKDIKVDCFQIPERLKLAPSFFEALLLQSYFSSFNSLPIANNQL